ncbi:hypothetical protein L840_4589 [Mycobacterium sp. MAC_011194_8550]|nr:hypothetical protein L840_4589 [Mycobacterium sp. MAC_011194_8550]
MSAVRLRHRSTVPVGRARVFAPDTPVRPGSTAAGRRPWGR